MYYVAIREVPVTAIFSKDNTDPETNGLAGQVLFWPVYTRSVPSFN